MTIIDTDVLIDAGRGVQDAVDRLTKIAADSTAAISVITHMELIVGCRDKIELQKLNAFLQRFHVVETNETISRQAVALLQLYRLSHGLLIADSLIAATALTINAPLLSKNQRHYKFIAGLNLLPYP